MHACVDRNGLDKPWPASYSTLWRQRDLDTAGTALLALLPALSKGTDTALAAAEGLLLMVVSARDLVSWSSRAQGCHAALLARAKSRPHAGLHQLLALHEKGSVLDPAAGEAEDDALTDEQNQDEDRDMLWRTREERDAQPTSANAIPVIMHCMPRRHAS